MMLLPPDYDKDGIYIYEKTEAKLSHRFTEEEIFLDEQTKTNMVTPWKATLYSNWSETQAVLKVPGTPFRLHLSSLFKNQTVPVVKRWTNKGDNADTTPEGSPRGTPVKIAASVAVTEASTVPPLPTTTEA